MLKKTMLAALAFCLSLSVPAFAKVESEQARIVDLEMTWPVVETKNKKADSLINKDIKSFMDDFRAGFVDRKFTSGRTWYETKYEDNQLVSLVLSDLRSEGNENKVRTRGVVYELDTGSRLPLSAFVRVTVADLNGYLASQCYNSSDVRIHPDKQVTRWSSRSLARTFLIGNVCQVKGSGLRRRETSDTFIGQIPSTPLFSDKASSHIARGIPREEIMPANRAVHGFLLPR